MRHIDNVIELRQPPFSGKSNTMPRKPRNKDVRTREYLTDDEVEALMKAAANFGRHGHRDKTLILIAYRHGLRVSELVALRWEQIDLKRSLVKLFKDYDRMLERIEAEKAASSRVNRSKRSRQRCGAFARSTGKPCRIKALANGRCKLHGGLSTGPKTTEGKAKALANLKQFKSTA